jgi:phosphatidylserine/phosphatidylglycerophosphate/cardiolipin synthase-like enzyme
MHPEHFYRTFIRTWGINVRTHVEDSGITVHAISGTWVVHLGFDVTDKKRKGLLGFAIKRKDLTEDEERWVPNKRTFAGFEGDKNLWPSNKAPVQKFRWGDYTAKPSHDYVFEVNAVYGSPGQLKLSDPLVVEISTENPIAIKHPDGTVHQIYFSRSGAASQAYVRRFGTRRPDEVPGEAAFEWLSRGLLEGMLEFIDSASSGDELRFAIYEFHHPPILKRVKAAVDRGVDLKILYDAGTGTSGPLQRNEQAIRSAGLRRYAKPRAGLRSYISHHKFMVLSRNGNPFSVWTGSTNMSLNGIYAQLNVGHAIESDEIAKAFFELHDEFWRNDPSASDTRLFITGRYPKLTLPPTGSGFVFSPRSQEEAMELYLGLMKEASELVVLTTPFGVDRRIEDFLRESSPEVVKLGLTGSIGERGGQVRRIDSIDGTRYSMPARVESNVLDQWQVEQFGFQSHAYIHTKFMLIDPLGDDPTLVTGSANFSRASSINNDENMLIVRGHRTAADVYLTEFLRMFEHYAFRAFLRRHRRKRESLPLDPTDGWTDWYFQKGSERAIDRRLFARS